VETYHEGAVAVISGDGELIGRFGDIDRPFFLRSAAKPFQAVVSQRAGAALRPTELALAAGSHDGHPVHVAIVESMLASVGLNPADLGCPPGWPLSGDATARYHALGMADPRPEWHTCSGKHAAWLRAALAAGWPLESYLSPEHPIQIEVMQLVSELGAFQVTPVGIDGCGAPVLRTTTRVMARLYAGLAVLPELRELYDAMHTYPALASGTGNGDASVTTAIGAVAKRGAAGCIGVAVGGRLGVAVKSWDGSQEVADSAIVATLAALGALPPYPQRVLSSVARPVVLGGGRQVGELEPRVELEWS
jgi:L-asparaginase II